jgi:hypothetical protein
MIKKPPYRTKFFGPGDELNHLSDELIYLTTRKSKSMQSRLKRFLQILEISGKDNGSIMLQRHWAQYFALIENWQLSIKHKMQEVEYIEKLLSIDGPVCGMDYHALTQSIKELIILCAKGSRFELIGGLIRKITRIQKRGKRLKNVKV